MELRRGHAAWGFPHPKHKLALLLFKSWDVDLLQHVRGKSTTQGIEPDVVSTRETCTIFGIRPELGKSNN
jgi:hypothetical protein